MRSSPDQKIEQGATANMAVELPHTATLFHNRASTEGMFEDAVGFWQPRTRRVLTAEDGRQIIENLRGFFEVLDEWDRMERQAADAAR